MTGGFRVAHTLADGRAGLVALVASPDAAAALAQAMCATYGGTADIAGADGAPAAVHSLLAPVHGVASRAVCVAREKYVYRVPLSAFDDLACDLSPVTAVQEGDDAGHKRVGGGEGEP